MNKKILYKGGMFLLDLIALIGIYFLAPLLSNNLNTYELTNTYLFSIFGFVAIQILVSVLCNNYSLLWMYRSYKNYLRMAASVVLANIILLFIWLGLYYGGVNTLTFSAMVIAMLLEVFYMFLSRIAVSLYFTLFYKKNEKRK